MTMTDDKQALLRELTELNRVMVRAAHKMIAYARPEIMDQQIIIKHAGELFGAAEMLQGWIAGISQPIEEKANPNPVDPPKSRIAESLNMLDQVVAESAFYDEREAYDRLWDIAYAAKAFVERVDWSYFDIPEAKALEDALLAADLHPRQELVEDYWRC